MRNVGGSLSNLWSDSLRILAVRLDNIGDLVMLTPALRTLRENLPCANITLLTTAAGQRVVPMIPWVDNIIVHRPIWQEIRKGVACNPDEERRFIDQLRQRSFEVSVIFTSFSQSPYPPAYACAVAEIPRRLGQSKENDSRLLTDRVPAVPDDVHQTDRSLHLLEAAGLDVTNRRLELVISEEDWKAVDGVLKDASVDPARPYCVVAPGASCDARRYDPQRFATVVRGIQERAGIPVVLIGSEREAELMQSIVETAGGKLERVLSKTSVPQMSAIIAKSSLLVANHSGPMHIAEAVGTPMVILFSGTDQTHQWAPRFTPSRILQNKVPCMPCGAFECPYHKECLDIPPELVVESAMELLRERRNGNGNDRNGLP